MNEKEPDRNGSTDDAVWLDLVARLEQTPDLDDGRDSPPSPGRSRPEDPDAGPGDRRPQEPRAPQAVPPSPAERTRALFGNRLQPDLSAGPASSGPSRAAAGEDGPGGNRPAGPRDYEVEDDDDGGFVPPEPPPLGSGEPLLVLAWIGAAGGPLLLLLFAMFWRSAPLTVVLGVIALFAGSAGYLLYRLPQQREDGDDGSAV